MDSCCDDKLGLVVMLRPLLSRLMVDEPMEEGQGEDAGDIE